MAHYPQNKDDPARKNAMMTLYPGPRPLNSRTFEHIWFALFGKQIIKGQSIPFRDSGVCIAEPVIFTEWEIDDHEMSPRQARWHYEASDREGHIGKRLQGAFKWDEQYLLASDVAIPKKSTMSTSAIDGEGTVLSFSESVLVLDEIRTTKRGIPRLPAVEGRAPVFDYRVGDRFERKDVRDQTMNGEIPTLDSSIVRGAFNKKYGVRRDG